MKSFYNEIIVQRGETFSIDRKVENKDGSPYIISSELVNPYLLITITSTRYEQENRYLYRKWIDLTNFPRFTLTKVVNIFDLKNSPVDSINKYTGFDDPALNTLTTVGQVENIVATGYINGDYYVYQVGDALFTDGISYKYWDPTKTTNGWTDYKFRFVTQYPHDITKDWVEQTYLYSVNLVVGTTTLDYLKGLCSKYNILYTEDENSAILFDKLKNEGITLNININQPLQKISVDIPILKPTKINVSSDLNGGDV